MFKVSTASLQTFIDTPKCVLEDRVQYSTVHIPNVFCLKYCIFACFCTVIVRCTWSVRKVSDLIFLCEHLMDYNLARLHEPTLILSAHA